MSRKNLDEHGRLRSKTVSFRVSPEEGQRLDAIVAMSGLTKQDYIVARLIPWCPAAACRKAWKRACGWSTASFCAWGKAMKCSPRCLT